MNNNLGKNLIKAHQTSIPYEKQFFSEQSANFSYNSRKKRVKTKHPIAKPKNIIVNLEHVATNMGMLEQAGNIFHKLISSILKTQRLSK
jgi:hypothetical protein